MSEIGKYHRAGKRANGRTGEEYKSPIRPLAGSPVRAFTLLEIMVAMTIIAILATIAMVAYHGVIGGSKTNQTRATLGILRSMLSEYENVTHFQTAPAYWEWHPSDGSTPTSVTDAGVAANASKIAEMSSAVVTAPDFWHTPYTNTGAATHFPDPMIAPGSIVDGQTDRYGSIAVINTQIVMAMLSVLPVNQAIFAKVNTNGAMFLPEAGTGNASLTTTSISKGGEISNGARPNELMTALPDDASVDIFMAANYGYGAMSGSSGSSTVTPSTTSTSISYVPGMHVVTITGSQSSYYLNTGTFAAPTWTATTSATPLFLDAWGNPVIFVPGSGLLVWSKSQDTTSGGKIYVKPVLIQSPDHKPFWASAGPDGDFSNGDDNIYSFEQ